VVARFAIVGVAVFGWTGVPGSRFSCAIAGAAAADQITAIPSKTAAVENREIVLRERREEISILG